MDAVGRGDDVWVIVGLADGIRLGATDAVGSAEGMADGRVLG